MTPGPKRKPDHLRIVTGSAKKHPERLNKNAPVPSKAPPEPPEWLSPVAAEWFRKLTAILTGMGIASSDHVDMMSLAASRYDEMIQATAVLEDLGATYKVVTVTGSDMFKNRPEVERRNAAMRHLHQLLAEFGLSPSAVGKVSAEREPVKNEFSDF